MRIRIEYSLKNGKENKRRMQHEYLKASGYNR